MPASLMDLTVHRGEHPQPIASSMLSSYLHLGRLYLPIHLSIAPHCLRTGGRLAITPEEHSLRTISYRLNAAAP